MPAFKDLTGKVFGRVVVQERVGHIGKNISWRVLCECGKSFVVVGGALASGNTKSCGCLNREVVAGIWRKPMVGLTFERLTVLSYHETKGKKAYWLCRCACGNECVSYGGDLRSGHIRSCGCLKVDMAYRTHGRSGSPTYNIWKSMRQRCQNPKDRDYHYYGGKGVSVCDRWQIFLNFVEDMGEKPEGLTLDRINPYGNYCPENCRWETWKVQRHNRRKDYDRLAGGICSSGEGFSSGGYKRL